MIKNTNILKKYLFLLFLIFSFIISIGNVDRWVVSEYIAMAENYLENGTFYPSGTQQYIKGVSVYTPGLAYFSLFLLNIGLNDFIFEFIISFSVFFLIFFIEIQRKLFRKLFKTEINRLDSFIYLILLTILLPRWFDYTLQFKPSIIAQTFGFLILYIFLVIKENSNPFFYLLLGYLYSVPIIFKQQYISFIIGFLIFTIFNRNLKNILFSTSSIIGLLTFYFHREFEMIKYWNYTILSDDGLTSLLLIFSEHYLVILRMLFLIGFVYVLKIDLNLFKVFHPVNIFNQITTNPIYAVIATSFFAVYLGLFKAGGNDGNIDGALVLLTPLFFFIFKLIDQKYIVLFATIGVLSLLPKVYLSAEDYLEMRELKDYVKEIKISDGMEIITDSHVYFASREVKDNSRIDNFHSYSLQIPGRGSPDLDHYITNKIDTRSYILIIENIKNNRLFIEKNNLDLLFENKSGLIALKHQSDS